MTLQAERIKAAHRGFRKAEPASASRVAALETFGLRFTRVDDFNVIVEGEYQLNLAMSYWRSLDGSSHGYLVSALNAEIKGYKQIHETPAGGRDSAATSETTLSPDAAASSEAVAESPAGDLSATSMSALMERSPWP